MPKHNPFGRRDLMLMGGAVLGTTSLAGCASSCLSNSARPSALPPVRASVDQIMRITVCTRPFRADGPRLDVEQIAGKTLVHNYGHGGSGWSLSWGSSAIATSKALATGAHNVAVIGCGALGLTSATLLQRAGIAVTIYAKDRPPDVRSSLATGLFTPDSRICLEGHDTPAFRQTWEAMCRRSYEAYQGFLGLPGEPVEWIDFYHVFGAPAHPPAPSPSSAGTEVSFAALEGELVPDLGPRGIDLDRDASPFPGHRARRSSVMMFNLTEYQRLLITDFLLNGGRIETREFHTPAEFAGLREATIINCTGYGARALLGDDTVVPIRGQLARLVPQPEVGYGIYYDGVSMVPRRDGLVVQAIGPDESVGYGDATTEPDRAEAEAAIVTLAGLYQPPPAS